MMPPRITTSTSDWSLSGRSANNKWLADFVDEISRNRLAYLLSLPSVVLVLLVSFVPIAVAVRVSLYQTSYMELVSFAGLDNYRRLFAELVTKTDIINSLVFVFGSLIIAMPLGLGLAILLNQPLRFRTTYRVILIAPWIISQTIVALLWAWLLNGNYGPLASIVESVGLARIDVLAGTTTAMAAVIAANVWQSYPFGLILILAALQTAPADLYEAVSVDGGNALDKFRHVTFPSIRSTLLVVIIMLSLHYFNMVTLVLTMTSGGPINATETLSLRAYKEGFMSWRIGMASAIGVIVFLANIVLSLIYIRVLRNDRT